MRRVSSTSTKSTVLQQALQLNKKPTVGIIVISLISLIVGDKDAGAVIPLRAAMFVGLVFILFPRCSCYSTYKEINIIGNLK